MTSSPSAPPGTNDQLSPIRSSRPSTALWALLLSIAGAVAGAVGSETVVLAAIVYLAFLSVNIVVLAVRNVGRSRHLRSQPVAYTFAGIGYDFTNPFRGLTALIGVRRYMDSRGAHRAWLWFQQWLHFIWALVILIGFFGALYLWFAA